MKSLTETSQLFPVCICVLLWARSIDGEILTETVGAREIFFFSPGYERGENYSSLERMEYRFQAMNPSNTLLLTVVEFILEQPETNCYDSLVLYDGYNRSADILQTLCGFIPSGSKYTTSGETILALFVSNDKHEFKGFNMSVVSQEPSPTTQTSTSSDPTTSNPTSTHTTEATPAATTSSATTSRPITKTTLPSTTSMTPTTTKPPSTTITSLTTTTTTLPITTTTTPVTSAIVSTRPDASTTKSTVTTTYSLASTSLSKESTTTDIVPNISSTYTMTSSPTKSTVTISTSSTDQDSTWIIVGSVIGTTVLIFIIIISAFFIMSKAKVNAASVGLQNEVGNQVHDGYDTNNA